MTPKYEIYITRDGKKSLWCRMHYADGMADVFKLLSDWGLSPEVCDFEPVCVKCNRIDCRCVAIAMAEGK